MKPIAFALLLPALSASAAPVVIDDMVVLKNLREKLGELGDKHEAVNGKALMKKLEKAPKKAAVALPANPPKPSGYNDLVKSIFVVASAYKCEDCDEWHNGGTASAWCLTEDGVMVTNRHVFLVPEDESWGVYGVDGKLYKITSILASDPESDAVLFRVDTAGAKLVPLKLGEDADVGTRVRIVSHPGEHFYFQTSGEVSRYSMDRTLEDDSKETLWQSVTAEFAEGSSGGPVLDPDGAVVGMVSNTEAINHEGGEEESPETPEPKRPVDQEAKPAEPKNQKGGKEPKAPTPPKGKEAPKPKDAEPKGQPVPEPAGNEQQMMIKNCVPASKIRNLIEK
ncbi:trypsin-like peptidase domain-containing protein [Luteolibacter ambystomatis]|uniref:Trypsin-like peptidase domain-containing protein n=1 Tax=Luteolibacter ambystomatis TaxID=2824561 RepID=A0A975J0K0_9BACT|nr:trypsin-like peptidase domain-containing protein [Luteolibacter ambystomatis]QUE51797.1 trypsin-like peptidase domain-containing protein [Luteolibacter ambystomatis]